jgi:hypothetical protein
MTGEPRYRSICRGAVFRVVSVNAGEKDRGDMTDERRRSFYPGRALRSRNHHSFTVLRGKEMKHIGAAEYRLQPPKSMIEVFMRMYTKSIRKINRCD